MTRVWVLGMTLTVVLASVSAALPGIPGPARDLASADALAASTLALARAEGTGVEAAIAVALHLVDARLADAGGLVPGALAGALAQEQSHLHLARAVLELRDASDGPARTAVRVADAIGLRQASDLSLTLNAPFAPAHERPSEAVLALAAERHVALGDPDLAVVVALDDLPAGHARALARVIDAFAALALATEQAYEGADLAAIPTPAELDAATPRPPAFGADAAAPALRSGTLPPITLAQVGLDLGPVLAARSVFLDASVALGEAWARAPDAAPPAIAVPGFIAIDGAGVDNTYTDPYALVIDVGGNDVYLNNAGGSNLRVAPPACDPGLSYDYPGYPSAGALLDLAGNDRYGTPGATGSCAWGQAGGAILGSGTLVDLDGDDTYAAIGASTGGAYAGSGLLLDAAGNDRYTSLSFADFSVMGGAILGLGTLIDGGGADAYVTRAWTATGAAYYAGSGRLVDLGGNDVYSTSYFLAQGGASTYASGFLLDAGGNDVYTQALGVAMGAGWLDQGAGFLLDAGGSDVYDAFWSVTTGGAFQGAAGMLVDGDGSDLYRTRFGAGNGAAAFASAGFLVDGGGNDLYNANFFNGGNVNGHAYSFSTAHLVDLGGSDSYVARGGTNGGALGGSRGMLVDASGNDVYTSATAGGISGNNGGASSLPPQYCFPPVTTLGCPPVAVAVGTLVDGGGTDTYVDAEGGTGTDVTVVPKGTLGAQIDL